MEKEFFAQLDNPLLGKAFKLAMIGEWLAANSIEVSVIRIIFLVHSVQCDRSIAFLLPKNLFPLKRGFDNVSRVGLA